MLLRSATKGSLHTLGRRRAVQGQQHDRSNSAWPLRVHSLAGPSLQAFKGSNAGQAPLQQGRIAVKCMAGLLEAAPHFNYRSGTHAAVVQWLRGGGHVHGGVLQGGHLDHRVPSFRG